MKAHKLFFRTILFFSFIFSVEVFAAKGNGKGAGGDSTNGKTSVVNYVVNPNPMAQGSILLTQPFATLSGLRNNQHLYVVFQGGYNSSATQQVGGHVYADSNGIVNFDFANMNSSRDAQLDLALISEGEPGNLRVWNIKKNGDWEEMLNAEVPFAPTRGTCSLTPESTSPGATIEVSGLADPNENLKAIWYDTVNCDCSWFACNSCDNIKREVEFQADASGNYSAPIIINSKTAGYCVKPVTVVNASTQEVIGASRFNICGR